MNIITIIIIIIIIIITINVESVEWKGCVKRKHALEEGDWTPYCDDVTYVHRPQPVQGKASLITDGSPYKDHNTTRPSVT